MWIYIYKQWVSAARARPYNTRIRLFRLFNAQNGRYSFTPSLVSNLSLSTIPPSSNPPSRLDGQFDYYCLAYKTAFSSVLEQLTDDKVPQTFILSKIKVSKALCDCSILVKRTTVHMKIFFKNEPDADMQHTAIKVSYSDRFLCKIFFLLILQMTRPSKNSKFYPASHCQRLNFLKVSKLPPIGS